MSPRVLIVDDHTDSAECLATLFEMRQYDARFCYDGPTAITLVESFDPDVVVMDIGMPFMDGYEVARHLRERADRPLVLVALTGYGGSLDRKEAVEAGFDMHILKPVEFKALEGTIAKLLAYISWEDRPEPPLPRR